MNHLSTLTAAPHQSARLGASAGPMQPYSLAALRYMIATWRWRVRFRYELAQKSQENPHLIDDMGLTVAEVEAEIGKRFWQR